MSMPHIPTEQAPEGLIAGPAADLIASYREQLTAAHDRITALEAQQRIYMTIATGFAAMLGQGQFLLPMQVFETPPGPVVVDLIEDAGLVVYRVVGPAVPAEPGQVVMEGTDGTHTEASTDSSNADTDRAAGPPISAEDRFPHGYPSVNVEPPC